MKYTSDSLKNIGRIVIDDGTGELTSDSNKLIGIFQIDDGTAKKTSDSPKVIGRVRVWDGSSPVIRTSDSDKLRGCVTIEDGKGILTSDSRKIRGTVVLQGYTGGGGGAPALMDSWDTSHFDSWDYAFQGGATYPEIAVGQMFTANASKALTSAKFYLKTVGAPTGNIVAKLYTATGTFPSAKPTGSALAVSAPLDVATVGPTPALYEWLFSGANQYAMINGTNYGIVIEFSGTADTSNLISVGSNYNEGADPKHYGNLTMMQQGRGWSIDDFEDAIFYVYAQ